MKLYLEPNHKTVWGVFGLTEARVDELFENLFKKVAEDLEAEVEADNQYIIGPYIERVAEGVENKQELAFLMYMLGRYAEEYSDPMLALKKMLK